MADALAQSAESTGAAPGQGAQDAVHRIAAATEGMRTELQAMLAGVSDYAWAGLVTFCVRVGRKARRLSPVPWAAPDRTWRKLLHRGFSATRGGRHDIRGSCNGRRKRRGAPRSGRRRHRDPRHGACSGNHGTLSGGERAAGPDWRTGTRAWRGNTAICEQCVGFARSGRGRADPACSHSARWASR